MQIRLPNLTKIVFNRKFFQELTFIQLVSVEIFQVLPKFFGIVVAKGLSHGPITKNSKEKTGTLDNLVAQLITSGRVSGFESEEQKKFLADWLTQEIVDLRDVSGIVAGVKSRTKVIKNLRPNHLAVFSPGFPEQTSSTRFVELVIYMGMKHYMEKVLPENYSAEQEIQRIFINAIGRGVSFKSAAESFAPTLTPESEEFLLDINTLLTVLTAQTFDTAPIMSKKTGTISLEKPLKEQTIVPSEVERLGRQILHFLAAYEKRIHHTTLINSVTILISISISRLLLVLASEARILLVEGKLDSEKEDLSELEIYVDFTQNSEKFSDFLAKLCVQRDLRNMTRFHDDIQYLLTFWILAQAKDQDWWKNAPSRRDAFNELLIRQQNGELENAARIYIDEIRTENCIASEDESNELISLIEFEKLLEGEELYSRQLAALLKSYKPWHARISKFFRTINSRPFGMLHAPADAARIQERSLRYRMSDDLLATMVMAAFLDFGNRELNIDDKTSLLKSHLSFEDFLIFLGREFGVVVDKPPKFAWQDLAMHRAAALNVKALKSRLKEMGYLLALSDELSAQYLINPFFSGVSNE